MATPTGPSGPTTDAAAISILLSEAKISSGVRGLGGTMETGQWGTMQRRTRWARLITRAPSASTRSSLSWWYPVTPKLSRPAPKCGTRAESVRVSSGPTGPALKEGER